MRVLITDRVRRQLMSSGGSKYSSLNRSTVQSSDLELSSAQFKVSGVDNFRIWEHDWEVEASTTANVKVIWCSGVAI